MPFMQEDGTHITITFDSVDSGRLRLPPESMRKMDGQELAELCESLTVRPGPPDTSHSSSVSVGNSWHAHLDDILRAVDVINPPDETITYEQMERFLGKSEAYSDQDAFLQKQSWVIQVVHWRKRLFEKCLDNVNQSSEDGREHLRRLQQDMMTALRVDEENGTQTRFARLFAALACKRKAAVLTLAVGDGFEPIRSALQRQ